MKCEQILYTATYEDPEYNLNGGYAVVAKSSGIKDDLLKFLEMYHYPLDCWEHEQFHYQPYKSMLKFKGQIIYTVATTEIGHDGRHGTYHTQHFVFDEKDFDEIDYDTRRLDRFVMQMRHDVRFLPTLDVLESPTTEITIPKIPNIQKILRALETGKKVAIITKYIIPMQEILMGLNPDDRIIPWSNKVLNPTRQPDFKFINGTSGLQYKLNSTWKVFENDHYQG